MLAVRIALALGFLPLAAVAAVGVWEPVGPDGVEISSLVAHPFQPDLVFAASREATFFRSIDSGRHWSYVSTLGPAARSSDQLSGLELLDDTLAVDAANAAILYVALDAQVFRSVDVGFRWAPRGLTVGSRQVGQLVSIAGSPGALFALVGGDSNLQRSIDGGATWTEVPLPDLGDPPALTRATSLAVASSDLRRLFVTTSEGLLEGDASGSTWTPVELPGCYGAPAIAHSGPATRYCTDYTGRVYRSTDGGQHWGERGRWAGGSVLAAAIASQFVVDAADPSVLYILGGLAIPRNPSTDLYVSRDAGLSWGYAGPDAGARSARRLLSLASSPSALVIAGLHSAAISHDQAESFTPARGLQALAIEALSAPQRPPFLLGTGTPRAVIYTSPDPGSQWRGYLFGFDFLPSRLYDLDADPQAPSTLWGALSSFLVRSTDAGASYVFVQPLCQSAKGLAIAPSDPRVLYAIGGEPQTECCPLQKSVDGGATWTCEHRPPLLGTGKAIAVDPLDPNRVYVADDGRRLVRSLDGGASWELVEDDLDVSAIAVDPLRASIVYAATLDQGIWRSIDRGATWQHVAGVGLPTAPAVAELALHPVDPDVFYASYTGIGVFVSRDEGASFSPLGAGLPSNLASGTLAIDPRLPSNVYAGTRGAGVWRVLDEHVEPCVEDEWTLCLGGGRFKAQARWRDFKGRTGPGHAGLLTGDSGYFWFFSPDNLELMVKALDGRTLNDRFWVFYGALSNVEFELLVTDTETGEVNAYFNPERAFASRGDTSAFPRPPSEAARSRVSPAQGVRETTYLRARDAGASTCAPDDVTLCLRDGRFRVRIDWKDFKGRTGVGHVRTLNETTGLFWFFNDSNLEIAIKILDGRTLNGNFWVFYGALSNVEYTITVEDTVTQATRTYFNPLHGFGSRGDTSAFPAN